MRGGDCFGGLVPPLEQSVNDDLLECEPRTPRIGIVGEAVLIIHFREQQCILVKKRKNNVQID